MRLLLIFVLLAQAIPALAQQSEAERQQTIDRCRILNGPGELACRSQALTLRDNCVATHADPTDQRQCWLDGIAPAHACFAGFVDTLNACLGWTGYKANDPAGSEVGYNPVEP